MEHRWGHRLAVNEPVRLRAQRGQWVRGRICNASISGAFIITRLSAAALSHVSIRFARSRGTKLEELQGQVVRSTREGLAIEWTEFAPTRVRTLMLIPVFEALGSIPVPSPAGRAPGPLPQPYRMRGD
jgi:hypothetical protein